MMLRMSKNYCLVHCLLLAFIGGGMGQTKDCNRETKKFSYVVKDTIARCSTQFHRDLQKYYKTQNIMPGYQIQPTRAIPSPSPLSLSTVFFANTSNWQDICQLWVEAAGCLAPAIEGCDIAVAFRLMQDRLSVYHWSDHSSPQYLAAEYAFSERTCESGKVRADLQSDIDGGQLDLNCLTEAERIGFNQCVSPLTAEIMDYRSTNVYASKLDKKVLQSMSSSSMRCVRNLLDTSKCKDVSKKLWYHIGELQLPSIFIQMPNITDQPVYNFSVFPRCTVGVYGDPHLLLCDSPKQVTCSLPGEHVYLANQFLEIRGTNKPIGDTMANPRATAVTGIKVVFKSLRTSKPIGSYEASESTLPYNFENVATDEQRIGEGVDLVEIITSGKDKRTFIQASTGAILVIRKSGKYYFFTLRMSKRVISDSYGLLVTGCSMTQSVMIDGWLKSHSMKRDVTLARCTTLCSQIPSEREFQKRCRFDCAVTKDEAFVEMARGAKDDINRVEEKDDELINKAITKWPTKTSSCVRPGTPFFAMWSGLMLLAVLSHVGIGL